MLKIARGGEERRAGGIRRRNRREWRRVRASASSIAARSSRIEREGEGGEVVVAMVALAEPRADDHRGDGGMVERPSASRHWRATTPCLRAISSSAAEHAWNASQPPAASMKRRYFILLQSAISLAGFGPAEPALARQSRRRACRRRAGARRVARQNALISPAARRSSSEKQTWLVDDRDAVLDQHVADARCRNW